MSRAPEIGLVRREEWTPMLRVMFTLVLASSAAVMLYGLFVIWVVVS